jgi:hypothetical protein
VDFSERVKNLSPEGAYTVLAKAQELEAEGEDHPPEIGQPDEPTFPILSKQVCAPSTMVTSLHSGRIACLRSAIAEDAGRRRG